MYALCYTFSIVHPPSVCYLSSCYEYRCCRCSGSVVMPARLETPYYVKRLVEYRMAIVMKIHSLETVPCIQPDVNQIAWKLNLCTNCTKCGQRLNPLNNIEAWPIGQVYRPWYTHLPPVQYVRNMYMFYDIETHKNFHAAFPVLQFNHTNM
jgi:hypothetical protein